MKKILCLIFIIFVFSGCNARPIENPTPKETFTTTSPYDEAQKEKPNISSSLQSILEELRNKTASFDTNDYNGFLAVQISLTDLTETFYFEIKDKKLTIEPQEYDGYQANISIFSENFIKMMNGKRCRGESLDIKNGKQKYKAISYYKYIGVYYMIYERLRTLIINFNSEIDLDEFPQKAHIKNDVGLNSVEIMELIGAIEDEFDIEIPERKVRDLQHIGQIVKFIEDRST